MAAQADNHNKPPQRLFSMGARSLACAGLFVLGAALVHILGVRENYYAEQSYVYAAYNACKTLLAALSFVLAVATGDLLLRLRTRAAVGPDALTRFFLGVCAIQIVTFVLGCAGVLYWQLLAALGTLLLALSEDAVAAFLAQARAWLGRLLRLTARAPRSTLAALRARDFAGAASGLVASVVYWAMLVQLPLLFVIFAILPNDQINDIHSVMMPYLTDVQIHHSVLLTRIYLMFYSLRGAGFGIFLSQLGDPYFWQLSMFVLYAGAFVALAELLRLTLPGLRLLRAVTLLIFSGAMLFKFNQTALHAAHTYYVALLLYAFMRRFRAAGTPAEAGYGWAINIMLVGCALLDPKLGFFLYALILADAAFCWRRGRFSIVHTGLALALPAVTTVALLWFNYFATGMADIFLQPLWALNDPQKIRGWMGDGLWMYMKDSLGSALVNEQHFTLKAFLHATNRIYGGQEMAAAHLICLGLLPFWRKRLGAVSVYAFMMLTALSAMGLALCAWQANEAIIRFVYLLEPESVLLKSLLAGMALTFIASRFRRGVLLVLALGLMLTLKPHNSLMAPGWLTVDPGDTRQMSLAIRDYSYKVFHPRLLAEFFLRGDFLDAHTRGGFPPAEPWAALQAMPPGPTCLVLGYVPQAYAMPGNRFLLEFHTPFNTRFEEVAHAEPSRAAAVLHDSGVDYLYLDTSEPFFNLSYLVHAEIFRPENVGRYFEVVFRGPHSWLLKLIPDGTGKADASFMAFYPGFYERSDSVRERDRHARIGATLSRLRSGG